MKATAKDFASLTLDERGTVRSRVARRGWLLAAARLSWQGRLRAGCRRDAACRRHALALAGHAARHPRRRRRRGKTAGICATSTATCWRFCTLKRSMLTTRTTKPGTHMARSTRPIPSVAYLKRSARALCVGPARGDSRPASLRLRRAAPHARRAPPAFSIAFVEPHRRVPDSQPVTSRS